jgi:transposase
VSYENVFIDGTKIEANANRYSFVWKKAVEKNALKLKQKVAGLAEEMNRLYSTEFTVRDGHVDEDIFKMISYLRKKVETENIVFVHGAGKKKSKEQKLLEALETCRERELNYEGSMDIFDGRNSYSKTDHDATFMRMKEDHMRNGQLKPGYNVQLAIEGEYIAGAGIFANRNDTGTLKPLLEKMYNFTGRRINNLTADSGYESEENYKYLKETGTKYFIKPQNYEQMKKSKFKNDISRRENMSYNAETDEYTCYNGRRLKVKGMSKRTSEGGCKSEITIYECEDCSGCPHKSRCTKAEGNRRMQVSKNLLELRAVSMENITSDEGRLLRVNRSIQSEGAFGVIKEDRQFRRFLTRGAENVTTETFLLCFAYNVNKLHAKIQAGRCGKNLHIPKPKPAAQGISEEN